MILNKHQAAAAYAAMVELNNVSGLLHARFPNGRTVTQEEDHGPVIVAESDEHGHTTTSETYADQNAFANAYGATGRQ